MTKAIDITKVTSAIIAAEGGLVDSILAQEAAKAVSVEKTGSNAATRKKNQIAAMVKAVKKVKGSADDLSPTTKALQGLRAKAMSIVASVSRKAEGEGLTSEEALVAMAATVDGKLVNEMIAATYDATKAAVFTTLDNMAAAQGAEVPAAVNISLDVPEMGKRFSREGAGFGDSTLDEEALRDLVGDEVWAAITVEEVIPAVVVRKIDEAALIAAATKNPGLLEDVRSAVKPGAFKPGKLMIRDIPVDEKE